MTVKRNRYNAEKFIPSSSGRLSLEQIRTCKGCEHRTDEELNEIIDGLQTVSFLLIKHLKIKNL